MDVSLVLYGLEILQENWARFFDHRCGNRVSVIEFEQQESDKLTKHKLFDCLGVKISIY